jgi:AraC-like DNA-binding protein
MAGVEAVAADTRHVFPRHTHDQFGIGVIDRGAQRSWSGRGMVEAGEGDVLTVNPGEVHDGAPIGDAGRSWRILYFDPGLITETLDEMRQGEPGSRELPRPVATHAGAALSLRRLFAVATGTGGSQAKLAFDETLLELLAQVTQGDLGPPAERPIPESVRRARCRIDDDPTAPVTLSGLAREAGLSRFQLLRAFARATGLTPHAYLVQRRAHLARALIAAGLPLAEAALASGFADQSHMTRVFTRKYGISPRAYADAVS